MASEGNVEIGGAKPTARRAGLNAELIVAQAVQLTKQRGLDGWSIRDLALELGVVPSVVYHYFPKKDDVVDAVVEHVYSLVKLPDPHLEWKEWFMELCLAMRPLLLEYHGVADRLSVGWLAESALPAIDLAAAKLQDAGFGALTPLAYSMVFNVAVGAIAARDRRSPKAKNPQDMESMIARLQPMAEQSPGLNLMVHSLLEPLTDTARAADVSDEYFRLIVESLIDGVEHVVLPRAQRQAHVI